MATTVEEITNAVLKPRRTSAKSWLNDRIARSQDGPFIDIVDLTPDLAKEILAKNDNNRRVSADTVAKYARDIANGDWEFNGQTLVLAVDGCMNDGQHRCLAVIQANKSIKTAIAFGMPRESRMTLDQGKARRVSDYLDMGGFSDTSALACGAGFLWQFEKYGSVTSNRADNHRPTKQQILAQIQSRPDLIDDIKSISRYKHSNVGSRGMLAFCRCVFAQLTSADDADAFFEKLLKGIDLGDGDPILYARNRLMAAKATGSLKASAKVELIIRAWNAHRRGVKIRTLPILGGETLPEIEK